MEIDAGGVQPAHFEYLAASILIPGGQAALAARAGGGTLPQAIGAFVTSAADDVAGEFVGVNPSLPRSLASGAVSIWDLQPTPRGRIIEDALAEADYRGWHHVGSEMNGYFPLVDSSRGRR